MVRSFGFAYDLANYCIWLAIDMAKLAQIILVRKEQQPVWIYKVGGRSQNIETCGRYLCCCI